MEINYLQCPDGKMLFSFNRHDYKTHEIGNAFYMIDGGFDYIKTTHPDRIMKGSIKDLISNIRKEFYWTKNYNKDNNRLEKPEKALLKDLETDHILGILKYFTEKISPERSLTDEWKATHLIFIEELLYRSTIYD